MNKSIKKCLKKIAVNLSIMIITYIVAELIIKGSIHKIEWDVLIIMMVVYSIVNLLISILNDDLQLKK